MSTEVDEAAGRLAGFAGLLVVRKIAGSVLAAVSSIAVVRSLGPDVFGQYAAGLAAFYLLQALTEFGFGEVLGRTLGRGPEAAERFGRLVLAVSFAWSCAVALAGVLVAISFAAGSVRGGTLLAMTPALALAGTSSVRQFFYARHDVGRLAAIDLSTSVISAITIVGLALAGAGAVPLAAVASAVSVANSLLILHAARRWLSSAADEPPDRTPLLGRLLKDAAPIGLASFLATAYVSIDVVILSNLFPAGLVGQYASAVKVLSLLTIFPGLVMSIALPQLSADWSDPQRMGALVTRLWHWFISLVMPGLVIVFANAAGVMSLLFGDAYQDAGRYLRILMIAGAVAMFSQLLGVIVVAAARAKWLVAQNVIALLVNVGGNLVLAPRFGIGAAAWLTVGTEVIVCGGSWLVLRDRIPHRALFGVSWLPVTVAAGAALAGRLLAPAPVFALVIAAACYVVVLSLLRVWPVELVRMFPGKVRS